MRVLIVEANDELGAIWARHLARQGCEVVLVHDQDNAIEALRGDTPVQVIVLNIMLEQGSALAVADYASYRQPEARIIFVTDTNFFSDGSIFSIAANACAYLRTETKLDDLSAMVEHYGGGFDPEPEAETLQH